MPAAAAATASSAPRRPLRWAVAEALRVLFRVGADAVLYGYLAALGAHSLGGTVVEILGRWFCGEGSAAEAAGIAVRAGCKPVMARLFPVFVPLLLMRVRERAKFDLKEEKKEKERREREELASTNIIMAASANEEQRPERNGVHTLLPKGVNLTSLYAISPLCALLELALKMQHYHEKGSLGWRVGSVLADVGCLGFAVIAGFYGVRSMVILVAIPKAKDADTVML